MGVSQRLRALDRRVFREDRELTEEMWRRNAGAWRVLLVAVVGLGLILAAIGLWRGSSVTLVGAIPLMLMLMFQAGYAKSEDDRLKGKQFGARRRPPGI